MPCMMEYRGGLAAVHGRDSNLSDQEELLLVDSRALTMRHLRQNVLNLFTSAHRRPRTTPRRSRIRVEQLEPRLMLHGGEAGAHGEPAEIAADFAAMDSNLTSSSYGLPVSPRDYLRTVSGWYFGQAT